MANQDSRGPRKQDESQEFPIQFILMIGLIALGVLALILRATGVF